MGKERASLCVFGWVCVWLSLRGVALRQTQSSSHTSEKMINVCMFVCVRTQTLMATYELWLPRPLILLSVYVCVHMRVCGPAGSVWLIEGSQTSTPFPPFSETHMYTYTRLEGIIFESIRRGEDGYTEL